MRQSLAKARTVLKRGQVSIEYHSDLFVFFLVKGLSVKYDIRKDIYICGCSYGSLYKGDKDKECYHVRAAKILMEVINDGDK